MRNFLFGNPSLYFWSTLCNVSTTGLIAWERTSISLSFLWGIRYLAN